MADINLGPDMLDNMYKEYEHSQKMNVTCWVSEEEYKDYMKWWSSYIGKDESHAQNYDDYAQEYSQKFLSSEQDVRFDDLRIIKQFQMDLMDLQSKEPEKYENEDK